MADVEHSLSPAVSIMCDIFGEKIVTNARKHLKLDADPPQYEIGADTVLILPFTARSGSTFASNLLSKHPGFGHVTEWFLPRRLEILRENWKLETHNQVMQRIFDTETPPTFASKCSRTGLLEAVHLGILDQFRDNITFFVIERHDKVAQAVSFHKARVSGKFHSDQPLQSTVVPDDFDFDEIYRYFTRYQTIAKQLMTLGEAFDRPIQRFWYEDFSENPAAFLQSINQVLGLPADTGLHAKVDVIKLRDEINAQWAERFREMLADRGLAE